MHGAGIYDGPCDVLFVTAGAKRFDAFVLALSRNSSTAAKSVAQAPACKWGGLLAEPLLEAVPLLRQLHMIQPERFLLRAADVSARLGTGLPLAVPTVSTPSTWAALLHRVKAKPTLDARDGLRNELLLRVDALQKSFVRLAVSSSSGDGSSIGTTDASGVDDAVAVSVEACAILCGLRDCQHASAAEVADCELSDLAEYIARPPRVSDSFAAVDALKHGIAVVARMRQLIEARLPAVHMEPLPLGAVRLALLAHALGADHLSTECLAEAAGSSLNSQSCAVGTHSCVGGFNVDAALSLLCPSSEQCLSPDLSPQDFWSSSSTIPTAPKGTNSSPEVLLPPPGGNFTSAPLPESRPVATDGLQPPTACELPKTQGTIEHSSKALGINWALQNSEPPGVDARKQSIPRQRLELNPPASWCSTKSSSEAALGSHSDLQCEERPRDALKQTKLLSNERGTDDVQGKENRNVSRRSVSQTRSRRFSTPSPTGSKSTLPTSALTPENQLASMRRREAAEDRKRARARACGQALPQRQAVVAARQRVSTSAKRWADESLCSEASAQLARTQQELFRRRDARIRRFLEQGLQRQQTLDMLRKQGSNVNLHDDEQIDLSRMEDEAEALSEELCRPLPPPEPCPLPEVVLSEDHGCEQEKLVVVGRCLLVSC